MALAKAYEGKRETKAFGRVLQVSISEPRKRHSPRFAEHSRVRALVEIRDGRDIAPAGSVGTVINVIRGGVGFDVEFTEPKHIVISARPSDLASA